MKIGPEFHHEYEERCDVLGDLGPVAERLIQELLRAGGIEAHSVRHRIKSKDSIQRKVGQKDASYERLDDIHDLLGLRVITFFPDEVDQVAKVIEKEFEIDGEHSVDKRALLDPDRFGYLSLHYVASLSESRAKLTEHARFKDLKFEIQIRSILQHAWAEIEHDLGYHTAKAIPDSFRRRFSRLAGLLEIADDEFQTLRSESVEYQRSVDEVMEKDPASVAIDQDSIKAFINRDEIRELDQKVAKALGRPFNSDVDATAGGIAAELQWVGLQSVADIQAAASANKKLIVDFAKHWSKRLKGTPRTEVNGGISLFYLAYILIAENGSKDRVKAYLQAQSIGPAEDRGSIAEEVIETYQAVT